MKDWGGIPVITDERMPLGWIGLLGWHNWWLDFDAAPFTARTLPG